MLCSLSHLSHHLWSLAYGWTQELRPPFINHVQKNVGVGACMSGCSGLPIRPEPVVRWRFPTPELPGEGRSDAATSPYNSSANGQSLAQSDTMTISLLTARTRSNASAGALAAVHSNNLLRLGPYDVAGIPALSSQLSGLLVLLDLPLFVGTGNSKWLLPVERVQTKVR